MIHLANRISVTEKNYWDYGVTKPVLVENEK
jgi:hypothetical protein